MTNLEALAKKSRSDNERLNMFMDGIEEFIRDVRCKTEQQRPPGK